MLCVIDEDDGVLDRILNGTAIPKSVIETIMCSLSGFELVLYSRDTTIDFV